MIHGTAGPAFPARTVRECFTGMNLDTVHVIPSVQTIAMTEIGRIL